MRPQHWPKNLLVFGGLFFSGEIGHAGWFGRVAIVAVMFCLLSSATYIFNDWRDMGVDRLNPTKRHRPLAAGAIPCTAACWRDGGALCGDDHDRAARRTERAAVVAVAGYVASTSATRSAAIACGVGLFFVLAGS
jgi:hypothetical protein